MWCVAAMVVVLAAASGSVTAEAGPQVWRVEAPGHHLVLRSLQDEGLVDVLGTVKSHSKVLVERAAQDRVARVLREAQVEHKVEVDDLLPLIEQERQHMRHKRSTLVTENGVPQPMDWTSYHDLDDIEGFIGWLNATGGPFVQVANAAFTQEGNKVLVVRITDPNSPGPKKKIWIEGGIHAREWISPAVTTYIMYRLATDSLWQELLQVTEWYIVPVANPDGYEYSFVSEHTRMWRKNRRINEGQCPGVDLNRNWNFKWGVGASNNPCSETYMGPIAFSEPETRGLQLLMSSVRDIDLFITFHSYGQTILYPWGWTRDPPANSRQLKRLAKKFADTVRDVSRGNTVYEIGGSGPLYGLASGATDDWAYGVLKVPYSYTIELPDQGYFGFRLPPVQVSNTVMETAAGVQCMVGFLANAGHCARRRARIPHNRILG